MVPPPVWGGWFAPHPSGGVIYPHWGGLGVFWGPFSPSWWWLSGFTPLGGCWWLLGQCLLPCDPPKTWGGGGHKTLSKLWLGPPHHLGHPIFPPQPWSNRGSKVTKAFVPSSSLLGLMNCPQLVGFFLGGRILGGFMLHLTCSCVFTEAQPVPASAPPKIPPKVGALLLYPLTNLD